MALQLEQKQAIVSEVSQVAADAYSAIAAEYRGLTVSELTELRAKARQSGVYLKVVKNTLAKRALEGTPYECMREGLVGPLMLAFSQEDPGSAARLVKDFAKQNNLLAVKMISIGGELLDASELTKLSSLPTKDQAISLLMAVMKAPVEKFVRTLNEPHGKLVRTIVAVRDQKQAAG
ncbi:MAG: 50S ribosomal protein L10 [Gammaproteobacteria bacterium]|nr:50S ribosomal protein L10 [Gammaproteobacteria bacterium]NNC68821.1 50S ribosomal protein L10 [Gammaproteobacteria bacterium]